MRAATIQNLPSIAQWHEGTLKFGRRVDPKGTLFGAPVPGQEFNAQRVEWGEILEGTARELMACEQPDDSGDALEDAEEFLLDILRDGAVATKEIKTAAAAHGHRWRTVERAKGTLGIMATKDGFAGGWAWKPPEAKTANFNEVRQHD